MKTKTYTIFFFSLLCACAFYFNSCKPDETPVCGQATNTTINFTPAELSKVPYNGHDTLYFKDINGDTNIVVGSGKQFYYDVTYTTHGGPACPDDVTNSQAYSIKFTSIKGSLNFDMFQRKENSSILINWKDNNSHFSSEYTSIGLQWLGSPYYIDSLSINNFRYGRIYLFLASDTIHKLYFNQSYGILSMKSDNDEYSRF